MQKGEYQFVREFVVVNGVYNIPVYIIRSGFGYGFYTFICKSCGALFVFNDEDRSLNESVLTKCENRVCPICFMDLSKSLVPYPEYIFHHNKLVRISQAFSLKAFDEVLTMEVFEL
jgi:hypothetical protein